MRRKTFSEEKEQSLTRHLLTLSNMFHGLIPIQLRRIVCDCAECCGNTNDVDRNNRVAGPDWFRVS
jgi:hypothetical protein